MDAVRHVYHLCSIQKGLRSASRQLPKCCKRLVTRVIKPVTVTVTATATNMLTSSDCEIRDIMQCFKFGRIHYALSPQQHYSKQSDAHGLDQACTLVWHLAAAASSQPRLEHAMCFMSCYVPNSICAASYLESLRQHTLNSHCIIP